MAYVEKQNVAKVGDKRVLTKRIESLSGYFEEGTMVEVFKIDGIRGYCIKDERGNVVFDCGWDCFEVLEEAYLDEEIKYKETKVY